MPLTKEPVIMVNGKTISGPESTTIRCALDSYQSELRKEGLGDDEHGKTMVDHYLQSIRNIKNLIYVNDNKDVPNDPELSIISAVSHLDNAKLAMQAGDEGSANNALEAAREVLLGAVRIEF